LKIVEIIPNVPEIEESILASIIMDLANRVNLAYLGSFCIVHCGHEASAGLP